ncbi:MAG: GHKL domain-containing protein [Candidatus Aminicenantes bacterium]|nr:MAG: GHKL domain-containing protein [Candidatus Aminicenantes bacterium]
MENKISRVKSIKEFIYRWRAVFFIVGLTAASMVGVIYLFNISNRHNVELITRSSIKTAQKAFIDFENNTANMLSATLEALLVNDNIAAHFLARDREALYQLCRPLFEGIKRQNRITHWYFLNPEPVKTCFLRVHSPHLYNDLITRVTLDNCIETKTFTSGKEMGKTAVALRAVHPYYYKSQLIGYMELGIQAEDFLKMLKEQSGNEYCLLLKKKYLNQEKWVSITTEKKIRNNWNDMKHLLLVYSTWECIYLKQFQKALPDVESIPDEGIVLEMISKDNTHFLRGIFPFYDAAGRKAGGILSLKDITPMVSAMGTQKQRMIWMILGYMGMITFFMIFFHKRAESELRKYRNQLEEMVRESTKELLEANVRLNLEIKEHKEAQLALEQECKAREEAEKKQINAVKHAERSARLASIGVMAASITHEINQPLNAIKVTADSIQYWHKRNLGALSEPFIDQLNIISKSVKRIVEIIEHMRTFWVIPGAPKVSEVDLNQAVKNAFSLTRQQVHAHGIREQIKIDTDPLTVKGNLVHFEQIIVNLVVNAVHALDEMKDKDKKIEISTYNSENFAILVIRDNGPGLPTEDADKLFDPFFSTHNSGEGMGLGLAIVKRYIDKYQGTITADNPAQGGARFTLKFPLAVKNEDGKKREDGKMGT